MLIIDDERMKAKSNTSRRRSSSKKEINLLLVWAPWSGRETRVCFENFSRCSNYCLGLSPDQRLPVKST